MNIINLVKQKTRQVRDLALMKENLLRQRAKVDWIKLGDSNNAYFFAVIKSKYSQTNINLLKDDDGGIT